MTTPHPLAGLTRLALWLNSDRAFGLFLMVMVPAMVWLMAWSYEAHWMGEQ